MVLTVSPVRPVRLVPMVCPGVRLDPPELQAPLVRLVRRVSTVLTVPSAPLGLKARTPLSLAQQGLQV